MDTNLVNRISYANLLYALAWHIFVISIHIVIWLLYSDYRRSDGIILILSYIFVTHTLISLYLYAKISSRLITPYSLFVIIALVFNGGHVFLYLLGLMNDGILDGKFVDTTIVETIFLVSLCISAMNLGALIAFFKLKDSGTFIAKPKIFIGPPKEDLRKIGVIMMIISVVPAFIIVYNTLKIAVESGYMALYQQERSTGLSSFEEVLAEMLVPSAYVLLASSSLRDKKVAYFSLVLLLLYCAALLFAGYRGHSVLPLLVFAWLWSKVLKPIPIKKIAIFSIIIIMIFPVIKVVRDLSGIERSSIEIIMQRSQENEFPLIDLIHEMGASMSTVAHTIELVPSFRDFDMGRSYLMSISTIFPNLFWDIHPAIESGTPSRWLVSVVNPWAAERGGGLGYSFIAESYYNFGWFGAPLVIMIIGFLLSKISIWSENSSHIMAPLLMACILPSILFYARSDSFSIVRPIFLFLFLPYVIFVLYRSVIK